MSNPVKQMLREKNVQSLGTSIFVAAINLVTFILLVRSLGKEAFGEWVIFVTAATLADLIRYGLTRRALIHYLSGARNKDILILSGSGMSVDLLLAFGSAILLFSVYLVFKPWLGIYLLFFKYYPALCLAALCWNNAGAVQNALQRFDRILLFRLLINIPFFIFVLFNVSWNYGVETVIIVFIIANIPASVISTAKRWNGLTMIGKARKSEIRKILRYGKFTLLTSAGSSLLRSADTLIIGLSPVMGAAGVAVYSIPFKIVDLIQIPLNAFLATASPKMSKCFLRNDIDGFRKSLLTYTGAVSLLFIPVVLLSVACSQYILLFFTGSGYGGAMKLMTSILYLVLLYGLILPFDRFTGVALDSAEMPDKNARKVYVMLGLNIIGNLAAVFIFHSLVMVAAVSVLFTIVGMLIGWRSLNRLLNLNPAAIFAEGFLFYRKLAYSLKTMLN